MVMRKNKTWVETANPWVAISLRVSGLSFDLSDRTMFSMREEIARER
jgi:hypothetical protein